MRWMVHIHSLADSVCAWVRAG